MGILDNRFANRLEDPALRELLKVIDNKNTEQDAAIAIANGGSSPVLSVNGKTGNVTVTAADVGLENVDDTSDVDKPISDATASALAGKQNVSQRGQANGYASLDATGKVPLSQMAIDGDLEFKGTWDASTNTPTIPAAGVGNTGWYYKVSVAGSADIDGISTWEIGDWIISNGSAWDRIVNSELVSSVAGRTGAVVLTKTDVGLDQVDNTADDDKPLSTAAILALADKEDANNKGIADGYASLGPDGKVPLSQLPASTVGDQPVVDVFYVQKAGNDTYPGNRPDQSFLTIGAAISAAAALETRAAIYVIDAGTYNESIELPEDVDLYAPFATLIGVAVDQPTLKLNGGSSVRLFHARPSVNATESDFVSNSAVVKTGDGFSYIDVREVWANPAGLGIASLSADGALHAHVGIIHVAAGAIGCGGGFATAFGHLHIYAGDIYLEGDGAIGVIAAANATAVTNVLGFVEHLIKRGGPYTGTVGFAALDDGGTTIGKVRMGCGTLDADTLGVEGAGCEVRVMLSDGRLLAGNTISDYLSNMQPVGEKGQADGYASLDGSGKVPSGQLPDSLTGSLDYQGTWNANTNSPTIPAASAGNKGDYYVVSVAGTTNVDGNASWAVSDWIVSNGASWDKIDNTQAVTSVAGKTGTVTLVKGDVGLGNVDNTADADKPVSTAQASAIAAKEATANKGAANGYCGLDSGSLVAVANLPGQNKGVNTQTGTPYVLVIGDAGKVVEMNNASANTLQVPPNSSVAFPIGTIIDVVQYGAGQTTIAQGSGVTIRSSGGKLKLTGQYSGASLYKRATDEWLLVGDITT